MTEQHTEDRPLEDALRAEDRSAKIAISVVEILERVLIFVLLAMLMVATILATIDLGYEIYEAIIKPPFLLITPEQLFKFFRLFLYVLIGMELLKLLRIRLDNKGVHVQIVIEVTLIALCNEIITIDYHEAQGPTLYGAAALLVAIAVAYYIFKNFHSEK